MPNTIICAEEMAYNEIRSRILDGRLMPGARLVHRVLAKELKMSPSPVVPALRMLERDGLVVNTPGLGATVRIWTLSEIIDSYHIRASQEALAARLAAERSDASDIAAMQAASEAYRSAVDQYNSEESVKADIAFHSAIVSGAHCVELARIFENLSIVHRSMTAFGITLKVPRLLQPAVRDVHEPIIRSIENKDASAAEKCAKQHVEESLARNLAWLEKVSKAMQAEHASVAS